MSEIDLVFGVFIGLVILVAAVSIYATSRGDE